MPQHAQDSDQAVRELSEFYTIVLANALKSGNVPLLAAVESLRLETAGVKEMLVAETEASKVRIRRILDRATDIERQLKGDFDGTSLRDAVNKVVDATEGADGTTAIAKIESVEARLGALDLDRFVPAVSAQMAVALQNPESPVAQVLAASFAALGGDLDSRTSSLQTELEAIKAATANLQQTVDKLATAVAQVANEHRNVAGLARQAEQSLATNLDNVLVQDAELSEATRIAVEALKQDHVLRFDELGDSQRRHERTQENFNLLVSGLLTIVVVALIIFLAKL